MPLTALFDEVSERGFRDTPRGMAHWAGTGPAGMKCLSCVSFSKRSGVKGTCAIYAKYAKSARRKAVVFDGTARSCQHFEER